MPELSEPFSDTTTLAPQGGMHYQEFHLGFTTLCPVELIMDPVFGEEEEDADNNITAGVSFTLTKQKRMSMDQYYISQQAHLPDYDSILQQQAHQPRPDVSSEPLPDLKPLIGPKLGVQPREEEGREILPPYSSDISLENVFTRKMELEGAVRKATDKNWNRVFATLQGTLLTFYKYKTTGVFGTRPEFLDDCPDLPVEGKKGEVIRSYNLHSADAGIAADYTKYVSYCRSFDYQLTSLVRKNHVIRIRAESDQFIISCQRIETFVHWLHALSAAIDLALPLDERELPGTSLSPGIKDVVRTPRAPPVSMDVGYCCGIGTRAGVVPLMGLLLRMA